MHEPGKELENKPVSSLPSLFLLLLGFLLISLSDGLCPVRVNQIIPSLLKDLSSRGTLPQQREAHLKSSIKYLGYIRNHRSRRLSPILWLSSHSPVNLVIRLMSIYIPRWTEFNQTSSVSFPSISCTQYMLNQTCYMEELILLPVLVPRWGLLRARITSDAVCRPHLGAQNTALRSRYSQPSRELSVIGHRPGRY